MLQLVKSGIAHPGCRDRDEVSAQRKQAAHKGCGIHVAVRAVVAKADQPRLGVQRQLVIQAAYCQERNVTCDSVCNVGRALPDMSGRARPTIYIARPLTHASISSNSRAATSPALDVRFTNTR